MGIKIAALLLVAVSALEAAGISVDSGLTPPLNRWIFRSQVRLLGRKPAPSRPTGMDMLAVPVVLAYGLRPDLTLLVRQAVMRRQMGSVEDSGLSDLFLMAKYRLARINTRGRSFGLAATLGLEVPSGSASFSSDTWNVQPGFYATWRQGDWSEDFRLAYSINGLSGESAGGARPGDALNLDFAVARQYSLNSNSTVSLAPVAELSYVRVFQGAGLPDTGENVLYLSPGLKFTSNSLIVEALLRIPAWQDQNGALAERKNTLLLGTRILF